MATMDSGYEGERSISNNPYAKPMSGEAFLQEIRRERSRCDRSGKCFSLILFGKLSRAVHVEEDLISLLRSRLRKSDTVGWYDSASVGVLLPATTLEGARRYVSDLHMRFPDLHLHFRTHVETYPIVPRASTDRVKIFSYAQRTIGDALAPPIPAWKRALDIVGGSVGVILFSPLFLFFPVYLKLVSPGPVFYKQERIGFRGKSFTFLKFRTMHVDNSVACHESYLRDLIHEDAPMQKLDDRRDPRIIVGARFLRITALDEVPQFLNVLKGDMSLVGPRPCIPYEAEEYLRWHTGRFDVLPGMSGLWQVSGKNRLSFKEMIRLDIAYSRNMSVWLDLKIIVLTFPSIVREVFLKTVDRLWRRRTEKSNQHEQEEGV